MMYLQQCVYNDASVKRHMITTSSTVVLFVAVWNFWLRPLVPPAGCIYANIKDTQKYRGSDIYNVLNGSIYFDPGE